jgi:hypothetical protein
VVGRLARDGPASASHDHCSAALESSWHDLAGMGLPVVAAALRGEIMQPPNYVNRAAEKDADDNCAMCTLAGLINLASGYSADSTTEVVRQIQSMKYKGVTDTKEGMGKNYNQQAAALCFFGKLFLNRKCVQAGGKKGEHPPGGCLQSTPPPAVLAGLRTSRIQLQCSL